MNPEDNLSSILQNLLFKQLLQTNSSTNQVFNDIGTISTSNSSSSISNNTVDVNGFNNTIGGRDTLNAYPLFGVGTDPSSLVHSMTQSNLTDLRLMNVAASQMTPCGPDKLLQLSSIYSNNSASNLMSLNTTSWANFQQSLLNLNSASTNSMLNASTNMKNILRPTPITTVSMVHNIPPTSLHSPALSLTNTFHPNTSSSSTLLTSSSSTVSSTPASSYSFTNCSSGLYSTFQDYSSVINENVSPTSSLINGTTSNNNSNNNNNNNNIHSGVRNSPNLLSTESHSSWELCKVCGDKASGLQIIYFYL